MKQISLIQLRNRIYVNFNLYFRYSRKSNCLYGLFIVVPDDLRYLVELYGFRFSRFADGATYIVLND